MKNTSQTTIVASRAIINKIDLLLFYKKEI